VMSVKKTKFYKKASAGIFFGHLLNAGGHRKRLNAGVVVGERGSGQALGWGGGDCGLGVIAHLPKTR